MAKSDLQKLDRKSTTRTTAPSVSDYAEPRTLTKETSGRCRGLCVKGQKPPRRSISHTEARRLSHVRLGKCSLGRALETVR